MKRLLLFFIFFKLTFSYINIHPTTFDKPIDNEGSYQEFSLFNQSANPILYRIYAEPYTENKDRSMHKWMNFYPKTLTLAPGESGKIQLNIASYSDLEKGEYTAVLGIREIPIYSEEVEENSANLNIFTDLRLVLVGYGGGATSKLKAKNLHITNKNNLVKLNGSITNIGDVRGKFELFLGDKFLGNLRIMKNESLNLGDYDFSLTKEKNEKISNTLIFKDYETKKIVGKIKI